MDINTRVTTALSGVISVDFGSFKGSTIPDQYCTFNTMSTPSESSEDRTDTIAHYVYLDLWSASNYFAKLASIHTAMETAGFLWQEERAVDEPETNTSHVAMTWLYLEAV